MSAAHGAAKGARPGVPRPTWLRAWLRAWPYLRFLLVRVLPVPAVLLLWERAAKSAENINYPPPSQILSTMRDLWLSGPADRLWLTESATTNIPASLGRLLTGWLLAGLIGVAAGLAAGRSARLHAYVRPLVYFGSAIPPIMLLPFFIALFEAGTQTQLVMIMFGVIWPVLLNSIEGARGVDPRHIEIAEVFRFSAAERLTRVILPSALPKIFAGLRVSLSLALILMVISEMKGSTNGIGFQLLDEQRNFNTPGVWSGIVLLGVLGLLLNSLFLLAERRVLAWHRGATRTT
ncbi:ABC transporter permease [Spirillospora sp. CA-294931]|uniref:ABC transporter permease n=1 Tax=Spirillospora sp. CA-294931 TaxID=3240042 RepID=UPI003D89E869